MNYSTTKRLTNLNVTTIRSVIALGKKFTTRFDVPIFYNSKAVGDYAQTGIGDISIRLLGYKFMESGKSAILTSVEFSFNTAQSPLQRKKYCHPGVHVQRPHT